MSVEEMGTAIAAESKYRRVLTQSEGEYLAQTFRSIRTGIRFTDSEGKNVSFPDCLVCDYANQVHD